LETFDPDLLTHGPGWGRGVGHIVGVAVGTDDGRRWYFPMRHTVGAGNLPPEAVLEWCRDEFSRAHQPKVFTNSQYDLGWLSHEGVEVAGDIIDVQIAEPLLDEHARSYSLETLAQKYLGEHKVDSELYKWCHLAYGGKEGRAQAANIWRAPPCLVGLYAQGDVDLPLRIWEKQAPLLEAEGLMPLFKIEAVIPRILVKMRMKGVRVDVEGAERVKEQLANSSKTAQERIRQLSGVQVDIWAAASIARALDKLGIEYPKTVKGAPSFESAWLERHPSEITTLIRDARKYDKTASTFIQGYILDKQINGRIHGQFHQLRGDDGGTVVGRFSSSLPNLENIPARDEEIGPMVRGLFLPEEGNLWEVADFSQIQFRLMVHYGFGASADEARGKYNDDPTTDFHDMVKKLIHESTGVSLERKSVKNVNFAVAFTGGARTVAEQMGISLDAAKKLVNQYNEGMPFIKDTSAKVARVAAVRGYIVDIVGRRHRFTKWEPSDWNLRGNVKLSDDRDAVEAEIKALGVRSGTVRAFTHLGLNRLAQSGEGAQMKKALVDSYKQGLFDIVGAPLNIVHDDVSLNNPQTPEGDEALEAIRHNMRSALQWRVPILVSVERGTTWGNCEKVIV
jgi:DNA polymerase I-like protein with 3'-5' exonuclease and polymerase domains